MDCFTALVTCPRHPPDLGLGLHHGEQGGLLHQQVGLGGAHHLAQVPAHHQSNTFYIPYWNVQKKSLEDIS